MNQEMVTTELRKRASFTEDDLSLFFELGQAQRVRKNQHLVLPGEEPAALVLVVEGCLMTYFQESAGTVHVLQFGSPMWWTGDLAAIFEGGPSQYGVKAMTATEVLLFTRDAFEALTQARPAFERYFRVLFQNSLISHQQRIKRNISFTAEQKYLAFLEKHPKLELLVPQKYIASYLGITPEFLSKLKRRLARSVDS